jgi:long-chain acyl-CoA synthetase
MTDRFRWHPEARLHDSRGRAVRALPSGAAVLPDSPEGLAQAMGAAVFRIGGPDLPPPAAAAGPMFETLTSGSTGQPRRILRSQASWIASFDVSARQGLVPGARLAVLGPLVYSLSLYGAVEGLHLGAHVHLLAGLRPNLQAKALAEKGISHLYASPAQLRLLVERAGPCPDLRRIMVGGSKLDPALRGKLQALAPQAELCEFYGAAETSFVTLADATTPEGSVGRAFPGVEIRIDGVEVWVRSPYLFAGYAGDPGSARWRDGWLTVGEAGYLEGGCLYLRGRAGRMVTVADQNVFPEEIETLMAGLPGVARAAVLPMPDPLRGAVLLAVVQGDRAREAAILAALRSALGPLKAPRALVWVEDWPVLPSGKTDLGALRALVAWPA